MKQQVANTRQHEKWQGLSKAVKALLSLESLNTKSPTCIPASLYTNFQLPPFSDLILKQISEWEIILNQNLEWDIITTQGGRVGKKK